MTQIFDELDKMISLQKERPVKTYVAKYNGKNLKVGSGKSSWKAVNHAKAAILLHFNKIKYEYIYGVNPNGGLDYKRYTYEERIQREEDFKKQLWRIIDIVELT